MFFLVDLLFLSNVGRHLQNSIYYVVDKISITLFWVFSEYLQLGHIFHGLSETTLRHYKLLQLIMNNFSVVKISDIFIFILVYIYSLYHNSFRCSNKIFVESLSTVFYN